MTAKQSTKTALLIKELREDNGWSQADLVKIIVKNKGSVTTQSISNWERGVGLPSGVHLEQLAKAFEVEIPDLFGDLLSPRPLRPALPSPVQPESSPVPPDDSLGSDEGQRFLPIAPESRQDHPERSIPVRQAGPFSIPLQDIELMT